MTGAQRDQLDALVAAGAGNPTRGRRIVSSTSVLLDLIEHATQTGCQAPHQPMSPLPVASSPITPVGRGGTVRVRVRMPGIIKREVDALAKASGFTSPAWLAGLVQSAVLSEPVFDKRSVLALEAATRELSAIGRNLNQVARALNTRPHEIDRIKLDELKGVLREVVQVRAEVRRLVKSTNQAWGTGKS